MVLVALALIAPPLAGRPGYRAQRGGRGGGGRDLDRGAWKSRREARRGRNRWVWRAVSGGPDRLVYGGVHGGPAQYLARGMQRLVEIFIALTALATAVGGHGLLPLGRRRQPGHRMGGGGGGPAHLGPPLGLQSANDVQLLLQKIGVGASDVRPVTRQVWGVARYQGTETRPDGSPGGRLGIEVYGRDAADARLLTKAGRFLLYRDSGPTFSAYPAAAGRARGLPHAAGGPGGCRRAQAGRRREPQDTAKDALLVCRLPAGSDLSAADATKVSNVVLDDLYRQLLILRRARITHGAISGDTLRPEAASNTHDPDRVPQRLIERVAGSASTGTLQVRWPRRQCWWAPNQPRAPRPGACQRRSSKAPSASCTRRRSTPHSAGTCASSETSCRRCPAARHGRLDRAADAGGAPPG